VHSHHASAAPAAETHNHRRREVDFTDAIQSRESRLRLALGALALFVLVLVVYLPILPGSFIIDDHRLIREKNPLATGELTPLTIWFQTDFALSSFALWWQSLVWGENPGGYHAVNMALHALSALLIWRLVARLKIPGAWLAAAAFAVHPVAVNSVARIAEVKNTLSLPFFILSFWLFLKYEESSAAQSSTSSRSAQSPSDSSNQFNSFNLNRIPAALCFALAILMFVLALLSKTSTVMLPLLLLGAAMWQRGRITREDLWRTSPFFALSCAFGLMSVWFQKYQALASVTQLVSAASFWDRITIAGRGFWFYLGKAFWPLNLNIVYVRWNPRAASLAASLPLCFLIVTFALCWRFRHRWGRPFLFSLGCFLVTLFPALGLFDSQFLTMWQVSDHLQYLPLIAPLALGAGGLASLLNRKFFQGATVAIVLVLALLTSQRARIFSTEEALYRDTLAKNPAAAVVHNDFGVRLARSGKYPEATAHFLAAVQSNPNQAGAQLNLAQALTVGGDFAGAEAHFVAAIKLDPANPVARTSYANVLARKGQLRAAIAQLRQALSLKPDIQTRLNLAGLLVQAGQSRQAAAQFRSVLALQPDLPEPLSNLAWLLATSGDNALRDGSEAVRHAERACHLTGFRQTAMLSTLAAAYAEAGRFPEAVAAAENALQLQTANGESRFAAINRQLLPLYRAGRPYHEPVRN
jgi:Flp pilus assembly protein TadD